jgi:3-methyl-2-oxobutanoate hydroxymethyltransferase
MVQLSGCDCVKLEVAAGHGDLVRALSDAGVAVVAHIGLRPQTVGVLGGYKTQGRTAETALQIVRLAEQLQRNGAAALLLEATPSPVSAAVVNATDLPVIGCGAGPRCHAHVVVTPDLLGLTDHRPRFVPDYSHLTPVSGGIGGFLKQTFGQYVDDIAAGAYPAPSHEYDMPEAEREAFARSVR